MGDSYRPGRAGERDRPPPLADRMTFTKGDNYRPGGHQGSEFTFESNHPAPQFPPTGPANTGASRGAPRNRHRTGAPQRDRRRDDHRNESSQRGRNNTNGFRRGGFRRTAPHERALLQHRDGGSPEHTLGVAEGSNRFLNIDDLSDDEEADMEVESDMSTSGEDTADGQGGNHKVARLQTNGRADGDSVPKWSNPDPYTALPPPDETTGVKRDVVQLIRKAKNQAAEKAVGNNAVAANDDFISFGDDDDAADESTGLRIYEDDEPLPERSKTSHRPVEGSMNDLEIIDLTVPNAPQGTYQPPLPSRGNKRKFGGDPVVLPAWLPDRRSNPTPWAHPQAYRHLAHDPEKWLHNEILDFYDFVAPQPYEHDARHKLVQRISDALGTRRWLGQEPGRILCFGSFPAGLYLPTADMDLVYASDRHYNGGPAALDTSRKGAFRNTLHRAARRLQDARIISGIPTVIAHAKVPIIKFKDSLTDIDVDISFENLSGVQAQATFDQWKHDYPDMIYMVALLKQFLCMRGLNEVHQGGIGGFSIICLIVSYLHHIKKPENLGECFVGFLEYYGKKFNLARQRIQMHPIAVVPKSSMGIDGKPEKDDGLSIQDPNRPENNISGGSYKAWNVFRAFSRAHDTLTDRMQSSKAGIDIGDSILDCILGGNYDTYIQQRQHLKSLK